VHVVSGDGAADRTGESIYVWNATRKLLEYLYIESDGGSSRGTVLAEGNTLVFPAASYLEDGKNGGLPESLDPYRRRYLRRGHGIPSAQRLEPGLLIPHEENIAANLPI
jgi:hypothetical protein